MLTVLSPVLGLVLYKPATSTTMLSMYLANPAIAGGVAGAILFGLLTIFELDRARRSRVDILTDAVVSPLTTALTRLLALLTAAVLTAGLTMLVWLPISAGLIGAVFTGANYVLAYLLFMGLALPLGILAAAAAYQFTRRADLAIVLFIAFCALSLTVWAADWQLCWLNPCVWLCPMTSPTSVCSGRWPGCASPGSLHWPGFGQSPISASGSMERVFSAPWPGACGGSTARPSPWRCWPVPAPPMPPSPSSTQQPGSDGDVLL